MLEPAAFESKVVLERLMQLYLYELSPYTRDRIGPDGLFEYRYLDLYWQEEDRRPFLIRSESQLAGFCLVRTHVPGLLIPTQPTNHIAEFFVLKANRRRGIGTAAARQVFDRFPGHWEVSQIRGHEHARAFWRKTINDYTQGGFTEASLKGPEWDGTVQAFSNTG